MRTAFLAVLLVGLTVLGGCGTDAAGESAPGTTAPADPSCPQLLAQYTRYLVAAHRTIEEQGLEAPDRLSPCVAGSGTATFVDYSNCATLLLQPQNGNMPKFYDGQPLSADECREIIGDQATEAIRALQPPPD